MAWTLGGGKRFKTLVDDFSVFVGKLQDLISVRTDPEQRSLARQSQQSGSEGEFGSKNGGMDPQSGFRHESIPSLGRKDSSAFQRLVVWPLRATDIADMNQTKQRKKFSSG